MPGIVGALLLTASRAIGETMIVVLAAGVAANLQFSPFKPMTTVTVKIVNQLTGDLEFNSPQTLVAFAFGMTLFVITLCSMSTRSTSCANIGSSTNDRRRSHRDISGVSHLRRDIGIASRKAAETRFRFYGLAAIILGLFFLAILLFSIFSKGYTAFTQTMITVPVEFSEKVIDPTNKRAVNPRCAADCELSAVGAERRCRSPGCRPQGTGRPPRTIKEIVSDSVRAELMQVVMNDPIGHRNHARSDLSCHRQCRFRL